MDGDWSIFQMQTVTHRQGKQIDNFPAAAAASASSVPSLFFFRVRKKSMITR